METKVIEQHVRLGDKNCIISVDDFLTDFVVNFFSVEILDHVGQSINAFLIRRVYDVYFCKLSLDQ